MLEPMHFPLAPGLRWRACKSLRFGRMTLNVQSAPHQQTQKLKRSHDFKHFLWRRQRAVDAPEGGFPEVLATDGTRVRRMLSQQKQIIFQAFEDQATSSALVTRIESSVVPGVAMVGYEMFKDNQSVAILHTGNGLSGGWLAFPDAARTPTLRQTSTLPLEIVDFPKMRVVAGASVAYERRNFVIRAALEQRGSRFAASPDAFHIFEHLESWSMMGLIMERGQRREILLGESDVPVENIRHPSPTRVEASFPLDQVNYKELRQCGGQVWFKLCFDRSLFCLPPDWAQFWLRVDVIEPPGILF